MRLIVTSEWNAAIRNQMSLIYEVGSRYHPFIQSFSSVWSKENRSGFVSSFLLVIKKGFMMKWVTTYSKKVFFFFFMISEERQVFMADIKYIMV